MKIDSEALALLTEKHMNAVQSRGSATRPSIDITQLHEFTLERQKAIQDEVVRLRDEMDPVAFQLLYSKLSKQTGQKPQAYFRRREQPTPSSTEIAPSRKTLLSGIVPVGGAIPGSGDERDLMAEYCLDDEFNPDDCDFDVGAALAASPDSEEVDAFAFSEMSPDYSGTFGEWPQVEASIFKANSAISTNLGDARDGSATTRLSVPLATGYLYTNVATPYVCHHTGNESKQCDPLWNHQIGVIESTLAPSISSLSPSSAAPGSSGTLTVHGTNLLNIFDATGQPDVNSSTSNITLSSPAASSPTATSAQINYAIAADAKPGSYDVAASTRWGTSDAAAFTIESSATAPSQNKATLQPAIAVSPLVVSANCSGEIVNPTRIVWWGSIIGPYPAGDIECATTNVMAGQKIYIGVPSFLLINNTWALVANLTWSIYDCSDSTCTNKTAITNNAVGAYTITYSGTTPTQATVTTIAQVNKTQNPISFYFTVPRKTEQVEVNGTFTDGTTLSAWARFYVDGPTVNLKANMPTDGTGVQIYSYHNHEFFGIWGVPGKPADPITGVYFQGNGTGFPGNTDGLISWVQIISNQQGKYVAGSGAVSEPVKAGLDTTFPYDRDDNTADRPADELSTDFGEDWRTFTATMYAMWDPGLPSGCLPAYQTSTENPDGSITGASIPSTCTQSIPIPLSSVTYHWSGCAINTLASLTEPDQSTSTWSKSTSNGCPKQTRGTAGPTNQFPTWTTLGNY